MKKTVLTFLLLASFFTIKAQEQQNIADLDFLYKAIQELPSYKDQLKNDKNYQQLYESLRKDLKTDDDFEVYQKLAQLIYPIKDNHLGFYRKPDSTYKFTFLKPKIDIGAIEKKYANYAMDSIEGIYYGYNGSSKYIVYQNAPNIYYVQNLKNNLVEVILKRNFGQNFDAIRFLNPPVPYILYRNIKFSNAAFIGLPYQKKIDKNYASLKTDTSNFEYKILEENIGYLRLSSFSSNDKNIKNASEFFNAVKPAITAKNLIVDVRNNGGGGYKTSRQFILFLNNYKGKIYILQNGYTVSNAEQFVIKLQDNENVTTVGEITKGTITYGSNYGKTLALPSNRFLFYPTDMNGLKRELEFESIGIRPKVNLNPFTEDWIQQTLKYIKANGQ